MASDPAPAMLEVARRNVPGAELSQGVATSLPSATASSTW